MHPDILTFRSFYDARLGTIARRLVRARLRALWPNVKGMTVVGLGYATPYLAPFVDEASAVVALMPGEQGAVAWPRTARNKVALADDTALPFADNAIDRLVLIHALESSEHWRALLRQAWRVLKPDGRMIIVGPNRRGLWAAFGETPFAHGHAYTRGQLERVLTKALFTPENWARTLYGPPARRSFIMRTGRGWERLGRALYPRLSGLLIVEASKTMYAQVPTGSPQAVKATPLLAGSSRKP